MTLRADESPTAPVQRAPRLTSRGRMIIEVLQRVDRPLSAMQLYDELRNQRPTPSLTTIYRQLPLLAADGLLHTFRVGDEAAYLACEPGVHGHLLCTTCGRVEVHPLDAMTPWLDGVASRGFLVQSHRTEVYGTCARCAPTL